MLMANKHPSMNSPTIQFSLCVKSILASDAELLTREMLSSAFVHEWTVRITFEAKPQTYFSEHQSSTVRAP